MASLLVLLKALIGVYGHDDNNDDDLERVGGFEKKLDGSENGSGFEFFSCVTMEDVEELKKTWKLLGQTFVWP
ncbi:hypothetical protein SDJN03_12733, partial [Cucurbita argyrosperma subsp. sororia]